MTTSTIGRQAAAAATANDAGPDLEKMPVEQVLATLDVKPDKGLTGAARRACGGDRRYPWT